MVSLDQCLPQVSSPTMEDAGWVSWRIQFGLLSGRAMVRKVAELFQLLSLLHVTLLCRVPPDRPYPGNRQHQFHAHEALPASAAPAWLSTFYPVGKAHPPAGDVASPLLLGLGVFSLSPLTDLSSIQ